VIRPFRAFDRHWRTGGARYLLATSFAVASWQFCSPAFAELAEGPGEFVDRPSRSSTDRREPLALQSPPP
jgi:hypothetical protein